MTEDIRDITFISHQDVIALNFINDSGPYIFRRHHRQGLRSHVLEVLKRTDVDKESTGVVVNGVRWFPKAKPIRMLRIFRQRLKTLDEALRQIRNVKIVEDYLAPEYLAKSSEFIVNYKGPKGWNILLCGFQSYEDGQIVDPWGLLDQDTFVSFLYDSLQNHISAKETTKNSWILQTKQKAAIFIERIKQMIFETGHVPDLAGIGNIVMSSAGEIKLVDINNISKVAYGSKIPLDDRGYPVCDKSIEALYLLETKIIGITPDRNEAIYKIFLDPKRMKAAKAHEAVFYGNQKDSRKG